MSAFPVSLIATFYDIIWAYTYINNSQEIKNRHQITHDCDERVSDS